MTATLASWTGGALAPALATFFVAVGAIPAVREFALRWNVIDVPNERSSHSRPIPRGAGIGIAAAVTVGAALATPDRQLLLVVVGACLLAALGFRDDHSSLSIRSRIVTQILVSSAIAYVLLSDTNMSVAQLLPALGLASVWMVGYVNAFNFMDGINGISAAQAIVAGSGFAFLGAVRDVDALTAGGLVLTVAFVAFLPFNVPVPRIFLGDSGSYFTGFWIAGLVVIAVRAGVAPEVAIAPCLLAVLDTSTTLLKRVLDGLPIGVPHRDHAYQRLAQRWGSHTAASAAFGSVLLLLTVVMVGLHEADWEWRAVGCAITLVAASAFLAWSRGSRLQAKTT